jgi:hypothetical protein
MIAVIIPYICNAIISPQIKKENDVRNGQFGTNIRIVGDELAGRAMDELENSRLLPYTVLLLFRK